MLARRFSVMSVIEAIQPFTSLCYIAQEARSWHANRLP
jgi:hypothetical protein